MVELHLRNLENFKNDRNCDEVQEVMWNIATVCKLCVTISKIIFNTMVAFVLTYSIGGSFLFEHYVLPFGYFFPWINPDTFVGYLINLVYQSTFLIYAYCGLQASDLCFLNLIMHAIGALEIIIIYLRKLNLLMISKHSSESEVMKLLHEIIERHIKHAMFVSYK